MSCHQVLSHLLAQVSDEQRAAKGVYYATRYVCPADIPCPSPDEVPVNFKRLKRTGLNVLTGKQKPGNGRLTQVQSL